MNFISKEALANLKEGYPKGARVQLIEMNDPQAPKPGTKGTVTAVDSIGTIHVRWDNCSGLGVAWGEDFCKRID